MELVIRVGTLENYKPTKEVKLVDRKVKALQKKLDKFQEDVYKPSIAEIKELIEALNKKYMIAEEKADKA